MENSASYTEFILILRLNEESTANVTTHQHLLCDLVFLFLLWEISHFPFRLYSPEPLLFKDIYSIQALTYLLYVSGIRCEKKWTEKLKKKI